MTDLETRLRSLREPDGDHAGSTHADLAEGALRRAHRRRNRRRAFAVAGTAVAAALLVAGVNVTTSTLSGQAPASSQAPLQPRENVLIIGSDAEPDRVGVRPDTIVLASIDTTSGSTTMFGFPRNLGHVPFPPGSGGAAAFPDGFYCVNADTGLNDCLLNSVWTWAESPAGRKAYPGADPGLAATKDVVSQISGLPVTQTVVVTMKGLQQLVDAVGGVTVNVKERLPVGGDAERLPDGWIEPGVQRLDGYQALWYVRSRRSTSDYDRMRRQQCLLGALAEQVDVRKLALNWPKIAPVLRDELQTSFDLSDLKVLTELTEKVRAGKVRSFPFTDRVIADRDKPDYVQIRSMIAKDLEQGGTKSGGTAATAPAAKGGSNC